MDYKFNVTAMRLYAKSLFVKAGMIDDRADKIADILVESDLQGHPTHGLKLLPAYLKEIQTGKMVVAGDPEILVDTDSAMLLNGNYLPGLWLVMHVLQTGFEQLKTQAVFTVVIRNSHHIACLGTYLNKAIDKGIICIIMSSDLANQAVAPFGGYTPTYSPNPIGVGIPTNYEPILIDTSTSSTANGVVAKYREEHKKLPSPWLYSNEGNLTNDPEAIFTDPPGSILPLGGVDLGYKGFAPGIIVEALTAALGGFGRADTVSQWGGAVFIQMLNPETFWGFQKFTRETTYFSELCKKSTVLPNKSGIFMPEYFELKKRAIQEKNGLSLSKEIADSLVICAKNYGVPTTKPIV
jgi:L-lactate dehydrogenase